MQLLKDLGNDVTYEKLVEVMQCYDKDGKMAAVLPFLMKILIIKQV
jgi:hypothetical protein